MRLPKPAFSFSFWLLGVAVSIGFNALTSELSRLADQWGDGILLHINLAFYMPSLPILLLSATLDQRCDRRFGAQRSTMLRMVAGFGGCAAVLAAFPFLQGSLPHLLAATAALGVCSASAASSGYQLATRRRDGGGATVAVALGYVCSAPLVLLLEAVARIGPLAAWHQVAFLYESVAVINLASLVAALAIARPRQPDAELAEEGREQLQLPLLPGWSQDHKHTWLVEGTTGAGTPGAMAGSPSLRLASDTSDDECESSAQLAGGSISGDAALGATLLAIWPAAASLALSVATSSFLFPLFTHFRSRGALGDSLLPVVLFWTRAFADIGGRLVPKLCGPPPRPAAVLCLALARLLLLPLPLLRLADRLPPWLCGDWLLALYVAAQWLGSGAVSAWAFLLLPRLAPDHLQQAASAATLVFNTSCLVGLLLAIPAQGIAS